MNRYSERIEESSDHTENCNLKKVTNKILENARIITFLNNDINYNKKNISCALSEFSGFK